MDVAMMGEGFFMVKSTSGTTDMQFTRNGSFSVNNERFVVDSGGHILAAWRMDGNGHGAMEFSLQKARAVAAWGFPTSGMEEAVKGTPGFADAAYVVTVAGGIPVFSAGGRTRIGGVGASGEAPADDAACAAAGIAAAGLKSERTR